MPTLTVNYPCGHPRTEDNTRLHRGQTRKTPAKICRECSVAYSYNWRKSNPERHVEHYKAANIKTRLVTTGWSEERFNASLVAQGGLCAICENATKLHADHDHNKPIGEGQRALLCQKCNRMLGLANDNIQRLIRAAEYLDNYGSKPCRAS